MKRILLMVFRNLFLFHMDGLSYAGMHRMQNVTVKNRDISFLNM
mgnify:FL=1